MTEHKVSDEKRIIVAVNNSEKLANVDISSECSFKIIKPLYGKDISFDNNDVSAEILPNDAIVFEVEL